MNIGQTVQDLPRNYTGGAPTLLERKEEWLKMMITAPRDEWVVLDKYPSNDSRKNNLVRNRVWQLNSQQKDFEFTSRTLNDEIIMFGRRK